MSPKTFSGFTFAKMSQKFNKHTDMKRDIQTDRDRLKENNQTDSHQILDSGFEELLAAAKSYGARIAYICVYNRLMARKYVIMKIASV